MQTYPATPATYDGHDSEEDHLPDWIDIMVRPRNAIQRIVVTRTLVSAITIIVLGTVLAFAAQFDSVYSIMWLTPEDLGFSPYLLLLAVPLSIVLAPIGLTVGAFIYSVIGGVLDGTGDTRTLMMAMSWSSLPNAVGSALLAAALLIGMGLGTLFLPSFQLIVWIITAARYAASLYSLVLLVLTISEVHDFSVGRALLTVLLLPIILVVVVFACSLCSGFAGG